MKSIKNYKNKNCRAHELTPMQNSYYIGSQNASQWGDVDCQGYIEIYLEKYDIGKLIDSWKILVNRHEMLRASIFNGKCIINGREYVEDIEVIDLSAANEFEIDNEVDIIREKFKDIDYKVFNKSFRGVIVKTKKYNIFHLSINLLFIDFASVQILFKELNELMSGNLLVNKDEDFFEYLDLSESVNEQKIENDKKYWKDRVAQLPSHPKLPRSEKLSSDVNVSNKFNRYTFYLDDYSLETLKEKSIKYGLTLSAVILSAFSYIISLWSENKRFLLNIPIQKRLPILNSQNIVGEFTDVNLLEVDFETTKSFLDYSKSIFGQLIDDLEHTAYSGINVLSDLKKKTNNAAFVSPFVFTGVLQNDSRILDIKYGITKTPQVWLDCQVIEDINVLNQNKRLAINWDVREGVFNDNLIDAMFLRFEKFLTDLSNNSFSWELKLEKNIGTFKKFYKNNKNEPNVERIQDRFIEQAIKHPTKSAVVYKDKEYSYQRLYYDAIKVSNYINSKCEHDESIYIGLKIDKNYNQIVGVLGILMSGFSYLPIDVNQPYERQLEMLNKAKAKFLLEDDKINEALKSEDSFDIIKNIASSDIAYLIFKSQTTVFPKGIVMTHKAAINTINAINNLIEIGPDDKILDISGIPFDLSVFNIFALLGSGGTVVIPDSNDKNNPLLWGELIKRHKITLWNSFPEQAEILESFCGEKDVFPSLRCSLLSGDAIKIKLFEQLTRTFPNSRIFSLRGATEAGIWSMYHEITPKIKEFSSILYSECLNRQSVAVIDKDLNECEIYSIGQIAIAGYSLAEGYLNDEAATKEKFIFDEGEKWRYYLTGEFGRYKKNGEIEFLGSMDNQFKTNIYKIETSQIECELMRNDKIEKCAVLKIDNKIIAFITIRKNTIRKLNEYNNDINVDFNLEGFNKCLTDAILNTVYSNLKENGVFVDKIEEYSSITSKTNVTKENQCILDNILRYLCKHNYIRKIDDVFVDQNRVVSNDLWNKICKDYSLIAPESVTNYIRKHAENFCELLSGKINPLVYLFPNGSTDIAVSLYKQTLISKYINNIISEIVYSQLKDTSAANILEVGGGIGATTDFIVDKLRKNRFTHYKYLFTDVSTFFLDKIKQKYQHMDTEIFDLNYGFQQKNDKKFDVIVAVGVLNNVINIDNTLSVLCDLLSDDGIIVIADPVNEHIEIDISQAFMMPKHTDNRSKTGNIFFSELEWEESIRSCKLDLIATIPDKSSKNFYSDFGQKIFVLSKSIKNKQTYKDFLTYKLPYYMIPKEFIFLDDMPLTLNGNIDKKMLENIYMNRNDTSLEKDFIAPNKFNDKADDSIKSSITDSIRKIYTETIKTSSFTENDNLRDIGFDSLLLSQAAGKIINLYGEEYDIKFDELLKLSLSECNLKDIYSYIIAKKVKSNDEMESFTNKILKIYKDVGKLECLNIHDELRKCGFDSLTLSQAAGKIINLYGEEYDIKFDELLRVSLSEGTINKIIMYIKKTKENKNDFQKDSKEFYNSVDFAKIKTVVFEDLKSKAYFDIVKKLELMSYEFVIIKSIEDLVKLDNCEEKIMILFSDKFSEILNFANQKIVDGKAFKKIVAIDPIIKNIQESYLSKMVICNDKNIDSIIINNNFIDCEYKYYKDIEQLFELIKVEIDG